MRRSVLLASLLLAAGAVPADDAPQATPPAAAAEAQAEASAPVAAPAPAPAAGATEEPAAKEEGPQVLDGMSVLGNQEAPKSLVIVPWKSSEIGDSIGIAPMLDDSRQPVDKDVFLRALSYYEIKSGKKP
jgi:hypothetical protein